MQVYAFSVRYACVCRTGDLVDFDHIWKQVLRRGFGDYLIFYGRTSGFGNWFLPLAQGRYRAQIDYAYHNYCCPPRCKVALNGSSGCDTSAHARPVTLLCNGFLEFGRLFRWQHSLDAVPYDVVAIDRP